MNNSKKRKVTFLELLKIIKKRMRLSTLLLLAVTIASNSFAWFIYATRVKSTINAHIEAWDIKFRADENDISENITFNVSDMYPGMPTYTESLTCYNYGEQEATITYEIVSAKILGTLYSVDESLSSRVLLNRLENNYPFKIRFSLSSDLISANYGRSTFTMTVEWPYESGNDALDTEWGERAYSYHQSHSSEPSIVLRVNVIAVQNENDEPSV